MRPKTGVMTVEMERNWWIPERFNRYLTGLGDGLDIEVREQTMFRMTVRFLPVQVDKKWWFSLRWGTLERQVQMSMECSKSWKELLPVWSKRRSQGSERSPESFYLSPHCWIQTVSSPSLCTNLPLWSLFFLSVLYYCPTLLLIYTDSPLGHSPHMLRILACGPIFLLHIMLSFWVTCMFM